MSLNLYDLTVPILTRNLESQLAFLKKAEQWCKDNNVETATLVNGKIADDMLPLPFQIQTCCNSIKGLLQRIGGQPDLPAVEDNEKSFGEFYARIESTLAMLKAAKKENFAGPEGTCTVKLGPKTAEFNNLKYVQNFALPNYFFHAQTAYLILRKAGVPVGKLDWLGSMETLTGL